ncbi:MAG: hypothetical protein RL326_717 [Pseudomonadota bacterium]
MKTRPLLIVLLSFGVLVSPRVGAEDIDQIREAFELARQEAGLANPTVAPAAPSPQPTFRSWFPIASHIKLNEGIPFPPLESIVWDPDPPGLKELRESAPPAVPMPTATPYQRPTRCERHYTKRIVLYPDDVEVKDKPLYDKLFLPEDMIPLDPAEVYGERARLYAYGPTADEGVYMRMESARVPCVPYRVRMTNSVEYEDFGFNALKNYTKDQSGPGVFDPWVTAKLFGKKK